jgi:hypothetical protein
MSNTVTSAFIDLATYDEIEKYLYNGPTAITYFVRCVRKCTWFAQVPVPLVQNGGGSANFGAQNVSWQISRAGDYLMYVWLRATLPAVNVSGTATNRARWVRNIGHHLIDLAWITFNDLKVQEFDDVWLDMWSNYTVTASKRVGYKNMIGDVVELTTGATTLPSMTVNVPLPFFFTRDTGIALPTAALPYNEMRINIDFKSLSDLLILYGTTAAFTGTRPTGNLTNVQLWANYAVVSNEERVKMGKCPRDMVIEQCQRSTGRSFNPAAIGATSNQSYDIRFSHSIKALFWVVQNTTVTSTDVGDDYTANTAAELSNYTTGGASASTLDQNGLNGNDPIATTSLLYENTHRLWEMGSDFFSLVQPFYHFDVIPEETGYHVYSYAIHPTAMDPSASTNYGKLTNVSIQLSPSTSAVTESTGGQTFAAHVKALNFNLVRVSGGALGLPVL